MTLISYNSTTQPVIHNLYAVVYNASLQVWNGTAFVALSSATPSTACIPMSLVSGSTVLYQATFPAGAGYGGFTIAFSDATSPTFSDQVGQQFLFVQPPTPTPSAPGFPATAITGSADASTRIKQQIADVIALKVLAIYAIANVAGPWVTSVGGIGPSYAISSADGSKSVSLTEFLRFLEDLIARMAELERMLLQLLQDLNPFTILQRRSICGGWGGGCW